MPDFFSSLRGKWTLSMTAGVKRFRNAIANDESIPELRNTIRPIALCSAWIWHNPGKGIPQYPAA
jgi:hypothetical protein